MNATTNAFLGKLCAGELAEESETLFQGVRTGLGYKRKEVSLAVAGQSAVLVAKDFSVEIFYALEEGDPTRFAVTTTLRSSAMRSWRGRRSLRKFFRQVFGDLVWPEKRGECRSGDRCHRGARGQGRRWAAGELSVGLQCMRNHRGRRGSRGCAARGQLEVVFPRASGPAELMEGFAAVCGAFAISRVLGGLIG